MSLSTSAALRAENGDERRATSTNERQANSSDMEIDDDDDEEQDGEGDLQGSSNRNDSNNIMESKGHDDRLGSNSSLHGKFEKLQSKQNESLLERKGPQDHCVLQTNRKSNLAIHEIPCETTNLSSVAGEEVAISLPIRHHSGGVNNIIGFEEKRNQMDVLSEDDNRRIKSRSGAPQTSSGSLSPGVEVNSRNKRPALICDFFAKGWCIKGNSCRFLHIKDGANYPRKQLEEDVAAGDGKRALQLDEGIRNAAEISRSPGSTDTLPSSIGNKTALSSHTFSERFRPLGLDENQSLLPFHEINKLPLLQSKDKSMGTSLASQQCSASADDLGKSKDVRQNGVGQNLHGYNYAKPAPLSDRGCSTFRDSFLPEYRSLSGTVTSLGNRHSENQSYHVSTWIGSLPFGSSLAACSLGAVKVSDCGKERHTSRLSSLLQSSSPFSRSDSENFPLNDIARDPIHVADYRIKIPSDDWEPSVPFQPSFFVSTSISSPRSQYDPLHDSIDLSNAGERSLKFSFSSQGTSLLNVTYPPTFGDSTSTGPLVPECNGDKKSASCHNRFSENLIDNCNISGKDSLTTDANDGTSAADMQTGKLAKEEISSVASHVKDISKTDRIDADRDGRHQRDGSICKNDLVDRVRERNEIDVEHKEDGDSFIESKAMRHFRAVLIDFIKELLKPTWREGRLSKDDHNIIVKKAVDKVLGTIQPHQIPVTQESVKQYLSASQLKMTKLVEAYVDKYGKS